MVNPLHQTLQGQSVAKPGPPPVEYPSRECKHDISIEIKRNVLRKYFENVICEILAILFRPQYVSKYLWNCSLHGNLSRPLAGMSARWLVFYVFILKHPWPKMNFHLPEINLWVLGHKPTGLLCRMCFTFNIYQPYVDNTRSLYSLSGNMSYWKIS